MLKTIKKWLKKTPLFYCLKYLVALTGRTTYPLPFHTTVTAEPFLDRAIKRLGKIPEANRDDAFYAYFSEMWPEGNELQLFRQYEAYLPHMPKSAELPFLDIGCGAGEFVGFLAGQGYMAQGIDLNAVEVERANARGLDVQKAEATAFLADKNAGFSGISMLQVIEHIPPASIQPLISSLFQALAPNGIVILETINTQHPRAFHTFYTDPTHTRPLPSEYLAFLLQWAGFTDLKIVYTSPIAYSHEQSLDPARAYFNYAIIGTKPSH